ncbi:MAG: hypothetical protein ACD_16C00105G0002 [uncultured bacterium]|nr:MAG: hypothetical protein ACD_16C00105G0002 [uncultured bacterium]
MKKYVVFFFALFLCLAGAKGATQPPDVSLSFSLSTWSAKVHPHGLVVWGARLRENKSYLLGQGPDKQFLDPEIIEKTGDSVTLSYPSQHLKVKIKAIKNRLHFTFSSPKEQKMVWPILGEDTQTQAVIYPEGEGLYIPLKDKFWHKRLENTSLSTRGDGLSAPFWGYDFGKATLNLIVHNDLLNELYFRIKNEKLINQLSHEFRSLDHFSPFEMSISLTKADPLAPAKNYKSYLIETGQYKTLHEKIKENPEVEKLIGALHAYVWGDGRTIPALNQLKSLGIKRLWLGYEDKPPHLYTDKWMKEQHYVDEDYIRTAKAFGYLVGPYDSFHTMQHPDQSDCANVIFDDLYPKGCIFLANGKPDKGFADRGCHVSSEALIRQTPSNKTILKRISAFIKTGINSYFLDCDGTGELFDDYSPSHPMTQKKDRENRMKRMKYLSRSQGMVLGSESAAAWAAPYIAFSHGNFSVHSAIHWPFTKDKAYGKWWPPERPGIFFKTVGAPEEYIQARYDPRYRLPLLQAVFHESVIMTDRWELSHMKLKNLVKRREILELLYGIPSIWALDLKDLKTHGAHLKKLSAFFDRLHSAIALKPLANFKWLTEDHLIQQVTFGDFVILTANFSQEPFKGIPPESLQVNWIEEDVLEIYQASSL